VPAADPLDLSDDANDALVALVRELRLSVLERILASPEPFAATYRRLLIEIDALLTSFEGRAVTTMTNAISTAAGAGDEAALDDLRTAGIQFPQSFVGVSEQLVRTAAEYSADLIRDITREARGKIARAVQLAALGQTDTTTLIRQLGADLPDKGVFASLAARAEAIARTEVSRVYSMAKFEQADELGRRYEGLRKQWVHSTRAPGATAFQARQARENHVRLSAETAANPIPVDALFDLGGVMARYPHDPLLPASESVHCRCRLVLVAPEP
jgi:hypothetical protein